MSIKIYWYSIISGMDAGTFVENRLNKYKFRYYVDMEG